jgi:hypothetical protein
MEGAVPLTPEQIESLTAGLLYAARTSVIPNRPDIQMRGQIILLDSDNDGVPDFQDLCPNTPPGSTINTSGCSIEQLCPCDGPWRNHGEYLSALRDATGEFVADRLITKSEQKAIMAVGAKSNCGKRAVVKPARRCEIIGRVFAIWCPYYPIFGECGEYPVPALVQVHTKQNQFVTEVITDDQGRFQVNGLRPGTYVLTISATVPPPLYFLQYSSLTQTITLHDKDSSPTEFFIYVVE